MEEKPKNNPQQAINDGAPWKNLHMVCKPLLMIGKEKENQQRRVLRLLFKGKILDRH